MAFKKQSLTPRVIQDLEKRSEIGSCFYILAVCVVLFTDGYSSGRATTVPCHIVHAFLCGYDFLKTVTFLLQSPRSHG